MTTFLRVLYFGIISAPVRLAVESRRASCCASDGACGPISTSRTKSLVIASSGRQPGKTKPQSATGDM